MNTPRDKSKPQTTAARTVRKTKAAIHTPDEAEMDRVAAQLSESDRAIFQTIRAGLASHLGSPDAARLWLVVPAPELGTTPLHAIVEGKAWVVLALLESTWGPSPTYA